MDFYWPSLLEPAASRLEILSSAGRFASPTSGFTRTISRPGERLRLTLNFENTNSAMRAAIQYALARMQGATHRIWAYDHSNRLRGSFPATELLTNNTFANGTTGWSGGSGSTMTVADRNFRMTVDAVSAGTTRECSQSISTMTQYAPYALRSFLIDGRGSAGLSIGRALTLGSGYQINDYSTARGLGTLVGVVRDTGAQSEYPLVISGSSGFNAGDYVIMPWASLARCALVDNGPNAMTRSDELDHADWTKTRCTVSANTSVAPDGTTTADSIIDDASASTTHIFNPTTMPTRTSQVEDLVGHGFFKRGVGTRDIRIAVGSSVANYSWCIFNLGAGTAGSVTNAGSSTNGRAFIVNVGNGWYFCALVSRAPASTTLFTQYDLCSGGSNSYTGDSTSSVLAWRVGCARSGVPVRPVQTVSTALASGASQALAGGLHIKGLPASTNGLLLPGDEIQIGNQLLIVTAAFNSDAAGLGFLQFAPALRTAAADNAPVVVNQPMGRFFLESDANGWGNKPGIFSDAEIVLAEAA